MLKRLFKFIVIGTKLIFFVKLNTKLIMKKITSKKLLNYGAMSAAILGVAEVSGQVVYTDLDPDQASITGDAFPFDVNGDTVNDFSLDIFDAAGGPGAVIFPGINGSVNPDNGFVGFSAGGFNYPSNLASGAVIDGASLVEGVRGDLNFYGCAYTNSQFCDGTTDGFVGLKFVVAGNTHYGWVRLDLTADASAMTIKDFAYNATPDTAITAGQGLSVGEFNVNNIKHYFNLDSKVLTLNSQVELKDVVLYNVLGQEAYRSSITSNISEQNLSGLQSGIYIAKINAVNNKSKTVKLVIK